MSAPCLLDYLVVIQGIAEVLFIGYVIVWGNPALLSSPINTGPGKVIIVVAVCGVHQAPSFVCIQTKVVGGFATVGMMIPEPTVPAFLRVLLAIAGSSPGVDCWHYAPRLGPPYWFVLWFDLFYNIIYMGGHFGSFEALLEVDAHFGQLLLFFVVLTSFGQYKFFMSLQSPVPPFQLLFTVVALTESMDVSEDAVVVEVEEGTVEGDVHDCLLAEGIPAN